MEKIVNIKSPFTGGKVKEVSTTETISYKGEEFLVHVRYYVCVDTGEQFTTKEQDSEWFEELHMLYNQKTLSQQLRGIAKAVPENFD